MAHITLQDAFDDLSKVRIQSKRFAKFYSIELTVGEDSVCLFFNPEYADGIEVLVDLIKDNLDRLHKVPVP